MSFTKAFGKTARFRRGWMRAGERAAHYFGIALFAVLWLLIFAPFALLLKLMGKQFLPKFRGDETTYYLPRKPLQHTLEEMRKQG